MQTEAQESKHIDAAAYSTLLDRETGLPPQRAVRRSMAAQAAGAELAGLAPATSSKRLSKLMDGFGKFEGSMRGGARVSCTSHI